MGALTSRYPRHMFLLPVPSATLAAWPMLCGSLALGTAWVAFAVVGLEPRFGLTAVILPAWASSP
ncbi:hypothetical protein BH11ARM2_BH11ARM2_34230 [soil metagenome]